MQPGACARFDGDHTQRGHVFLLTTNQQPLTFYIPQRCCTEASCLAALWWRRQKLFVTIPDQKMSSGLGQLQTQPCRCHCLQIYSLVAIY